MNVYEQNRNPQRHQEEESRNECTDVGVGGMGGIHHGRDTRVHRDELSKAGSASCIVPRYEVREGVQMTMEPKIKVMIVDDHEIVRDGLREILHQTGEFEVVGEAATLDEAFGRVVEAAPDVVIMDILMPEGNGIEACRDIRELRPETRVLMLTASHDHEAIVKSIVAGATGYLQKYAGMDSLLAALRGVARGEFHVQGDAVRGLLTGEGVELTDRERAILRMFVQGMSYAQIAEVQGNRPLTVRNTIYGIQRKLGVRTEY